MPAGSVALLQLAAYGAESQYLTGNPQMTYWKMVYRRYTNFALDDREVTLTGPTALQPEEPITLKCVLPRHGDLVSALYLLVDLPDVYSDYVPADAGGAPNLCVEPLGHVVRRPCVNLLGRALGANAAPPAPSPIVVVVIGRSSRMRITRGCAAGGDGAGRAERGPWRRGIHTFLSADLARVGCQPF